MSEPPRNVLETSGQVASDVVSGLKGNPALLTVVVLNVLAVAIGVWFLAKIADNAQQQRDYLFKLIETCLNRQGQLVPPIPGTQRETLVEKQ